MASAAMTGERSADLARPLFIATVLAGSFLLFLMQPMIARMALPRLGGAPAVWNSAMLVYQALLLGGYTYAHALGRFAPRMQAAIHLAMLAAAALWLPIGLSDIVEPAGAAPALWAPWLLAISIGPLFFAVSAQAPLMQRWFAMGRPGGNPYALYAASNLGSFGGLIAYPLLVEPGLRLADQSLGWSVGYILLALLVAACATRLPKQAATQAPAAAGPRPTRRQWIIWIALATVPSGLMLATTTHLTTDIIAMPLIWVVPLGLYLLSFSVAFAQHGRAATLIGRAFPLVLIVGAGVASISGAINPFLSAVTDVLLLFVVAVTLHREMYRRRPDAAHLTAFYLAMSIGGVLGGIFCALIAPSVFDWVYEYPLLILAAALLMPHRPGAALDADAASARRARWFAVTAVLLSLYASGLLLSDPSKMAKIAALIALGLLARATLGHRIAFGVSVAALILGIGGWDNVNLSLAKDARTRSYFGVYTVGPRHGDQTLVHGTTTHGVQRLARGHETDATSYYAQRSGVGLAMRAAPALFGPGARIGVVGLGAGTLACYRRPDQDWRFYEIDPAVAAIARNPSKFTFLSRCAPQAPILIGDARLTLANAPAGALELLVIDAFSSDAVPMHLLTTEAFGVYGRALAPKGLLMVHISNRFMDLAPVVAAAARDGGWAAALRDYQPTPAEMARAATRSVWIALSHDPATLRTVEKAGEDWSPLHPRSGFTAWTDDYGSILPVLRRFR